MIELCGARPVGGTIDVGGPGPSPRAIRLREARLERLLGARGAARRRGGDPAPARLRRRRDARRRARRPRAALAPRRRHARGRPRSRRSRACGGWTSCPPRCRRAAARPAGSRPSSACAAAPRTRCVGAGLLRGRSAGASPRPTSPTGCACPPTTRAAPPCALENPMSEDQSVMRTTLLGSLLDVARHNRARGVDDVRLFEYGAVYLDAPAQRTARSRPATRGIRGSTRLPDERTHLGALLTGRVRPPTWREPTRRGRTSSRPRRVLAALLGALRVRLARRARRASRSCTRAARRGCSSAASRRAGSASCTRRSPPRGTSSDGGRRSSSTGRARRRRAATSPRYEDLTSLPGRPPGPRGHASPTTCPRRACSRSSATPAARCCARAEVFDVYRGAQVGEGRVSLALRLEFRAPRPHADRRGGRPAAREDRRRARRAGRRRAAWLASPCSARAATPARSPPCSCTAIRTSSSRT